MVDDLAAADDEVEALALSGEHAEVGQRVTVDQQQVGGGTGSDDAELARPAEQLGVDARRGSQHIERGLHLGPQQQLLGLRRVGLAEETRTPASTEIWIASGPAVSKSST